MSEALLATKLHIPALHGNLVNRARLIQQLNSGFAQKCRLTLISAPAGYGKSTLLSDWISQVHVPAAWLSLEQAENIPSRFWYYFATALNTMPQFCQTGLGEAIFQTLRSAQPLSMELVLGDLVNGFSSLEERVVLVLDDFHHITEDRILHDLTYLIDHLPISAGGLHLVIASRMDPPWPLARWRARGELIEIRSSDLRFTDEETFQFLQKSTRSGLSSQEIAVIQERTEGWVAGLQMAAVSLQGWWQSEGSQGVSRFIESFSGSHRFILDYLMEEVISQQIPEVQDFLQRTSILEQLTIPLCDELTDRQDSQMMLQAVERANLFLIPLDDERCWYRYHHLFAELLRKWLKQNQPHLINELHQRASRWYARNHRFPEAISHALDSGDYLLVNELVSGNVLAMMERMELSVVLRHFEQMPAHELEAKPWLSVAYAWTKAYVDPSEGLDWKLGQVESGLSGVEDTAEGQRLSSHLDAIRAYKAWVKGRAEEALMYAARSLENLPEDDWLARCHLLNIEGLAYQYLMDLNQAVKSFEAAVAAGEKTGRSDETFHACTNLAFARFIQGRLRQAFSLCQQVIDTAGQTGELAVQMPVLAYAFATQSQVQLEWNDVRTAVASARRAVALAKHWSQADTLHYALTCLSEALCAGDDLEEAIEVNQRATRLAKNVSPWFFRISTYHAIDLTLAKGNLREAARLLEEIEPLIEVRDQIGSYLIVKTAMLLAQDRFTDVALILEKPVSEMELRGRNWPLMVLQPCLALALYAIGRKEEAHALLGRCLTLAAPEGYVRTFVKLGEPMRKLLEAAPLGIEEDFVHQVLSEFPESPLTPEAPGIPLSASRSTISTLVEPLSERETEVLRFLQTHLSILEIAGEMCIAPSTLRTHVRNIFIKLDAHRRIEAIEKAKELSLL